MEKIPKSRERDVYPGTNDIQIELEKKLLITYYS